MYVCVRTYVSGWLRSPKANRTTEMTKNNRNDKAIDQKNKEAKMLEKQNSTINKTLTQNQNRTEESLFDSAPHCPLRFRAGRQTRQRPPWNTSRAQRRQPGHIDRTIITRAVAYLGHRTYDLPSLENVKLADNASHGPEICLKRLSDRYQNSPREFSSLSSNYRVKNKNPG